LSGFRLAWYDLVGATGVAILIGAYLLLQRGRLRGSDRAYYAANAAGAGLVMISLVFDFNLAAFVVEAFWLLISLLGVLGAGRGANRADAP